MKAVLQLACIFLLAEACNIAAATLYVSQASSNPIPPYATWGTAATNIQDAVDAASAGDTVLVTNGIYTTGSQLGRPGFDARLTVRASLNKPLTLLSVNGPASTIIVGAPPPVGSAWDWGAVSCAYVGSNAVLSGFTLTNGHTFHLATSEFEDSLGGGVFSESSAVVTNCILINNSALNGGGAAGGTLINCVLIGNSATENFPYAYGGGGAYQSTLLNCLVISNTGPIGGGARECNLVNCTVTGNQADIGGGAAYGTATNSIIYYNTATNSPNSYSNALSYCCTMPMPDSGAQNFSTPPNFVDMPDGNFRLQPGSPCINTGSNAAVGSATDFDGKPRIFDGTVDLGVFEFQGAVAPVIARQPLSQIAAAGDTIALTVIASGTPALAYQWQFNGAPIPAATHSSLTLSGLTTSQSGLYSVIVTNSLGTATSTVASVTVHVPVTLYVWQDSANPQPPYATWSTAAHTIQDAVDATGPRDEVVVTNGIYVTGGRTGGTGALANRVAVEKVVTLRSVNGPGTTIIQGSPVAWPWALSIRPVYLVEGVVLNGFTLSNGVCSFVFPANLPDNLGGGVYCTSTNVLITNCVISGNWASLGGGAFGGTLMDCVLTGNRAGLGGGCYGSMLTNCVLSGNKGTPGGGAYDSTLDHCMLTGNVADGSYGGGASSSFLYNCTLTGNSATNGTAAQNCTLYNSILATNGPWFAVASQCTLHNCALTGNASGGAAGSMLYNCTLTDNQLGGAWSSQLYNCIVYNNTASAGANYDVWCTLNYCCTTPAPTNGVGNITNNPALSSSWRISSSSPCRGAGNTAYASGLDLDGEPWLNPPSIGCDEFYSGSLTGALSVTITTSWTNVAAGFVLALDGSIAGAASGTRWEFGDGTIESNRLHTSHQWFTPGTYEVVLRAYNNDNPAGVTAAVDIQVVATPVLYVDINSSHATAPYINWGTAASNIQDAVQAATVPGALILVSNGVYNIGGNTSNRVTVDKPLVLQSINGPKATTIQGATNQPGGIRCVYLTSGAALSGFTLTGGSTSDYTGGGGVYCESASAVLTNCALTDNSSGYNGGGAVGGTLYDCILSANSSSFGGGANGATLNHCILSNNIAGNGGGAAQARLNGCTLIANIAANGGGANFSTLSNCRLVGNTAQNDGGGALSCTLNNCLLTGNRASNYGAGGASGSTVNNCTLTGNTGDSSRGYGSGAYNCQLVNCIVYYNTPPNYSESTLNYCCTTPMPASGIGNIGNEPLFVDYAGGNLHLQFNSPCINHGENASVFESTDLDGNPRIVGGVVDLGAYEFQGTGSASFYTWLQSYGLPSDGSADYADPDGDGMNNWEEWVCGTNPTNALAALRLVSALPSAANGITVSWQSVPGIIYSLERSTNSDLSFTVLATNIVGQASVTTFTDTSATRLGPSFYRVSVAPP